MKVIYNLRSLHGNNIFDVKGNLISFKWEKKNFNLSHVVFELSEFEDGETGKSQKIKWSKFQNF